MGRKTANTRKNVIGEAQVAHHIPLRVRIILNIRAFLNFVDFWFIWLVFGVGLGILGVLARNVAK